MPLQAGSSALLWQEAGGLDATELEDGDVATPKASKTIYQPAGHRKRDSEHLYDSDAEDAAAIAGPATLRLGGGSAVNNEEDEELSFARPAPVRADRKARVQEDSQWSDVHASMSDEEYTYNPDQELEDIQADKHAAYEGQAQYGRIDFGQFNKYMANKRRKLVVQQDAGLLNKSEEDKSTVLAGLRIYINGETDPPQHVLSRLIVENGGRYVPYLDGTKTKATHIIASNLTPSKRIAFKEYKVVTSGWVMDSIRLKKVQDWRNYREDQVQARASDMGNAPSGTRIAQPRLSFARPAIQRADSKPIVKEGSHSSNVKESQEDEDEYTNNPDQDLADVQENNKAAYNDQQFYEKTGFDDINKFMANKRKKLVVQQNAELLNSDDTGKSDTLKGIGIYINGDTEPPQPILSKLIGMHGGTYVQYLDGTKTKASHIVASNLTPSKRIAFKEYKVITAEWVMDSIRLRKVQDWRNYREDQVQARSSDMGVAPDGTQIAQPRLAFAKPAVYRGGVGIGTSSSLDIIEAPPAAQPAAGSSNAVKSPRRLPPPTSDPISLLHVEGAEQAAAGPSGHQPPWVAQGWYNTKSNERSASLLKDEAWRLNETAVNTTEFLDKYYRESRLHWLSTWKAELKKMVNDLSEGREIDISDTLDKRKKKPLKGTEADGRVILHVDFDSFFVAVSLLARPHLKGLPVVVCHAAQGDVNSSSEIASASYEAREFGVKNGMSLGSARSRCPQLQTVPYEFELYRSISAKFYEILFSHAKELEAVSIDEAYISLPPVEPPRTGEQLLAEAETIRSEIREATGCSTSIGVSHNKLLARLATNRAKPSSSFQIGNGVDPSGDSLKAFLRDIDIESLPGIGWKRANEVEDKLSELSKRIQTGHFAAKRADTSGKGKGRVEEEPDFSKVGHLLPFQKNHLSKALGEKTGEMLYNYARGIDGRELETENVRKSVSAEVNYGIRFKSAKEVETFCMGLGGEVAKRLVGLGYKGRQLTLKVMRRATEAPIEPPKFLGHGVCDTFNSSKQLELTNDESLIGRACWELMQALKCPPEELRGIGLQMQKLESASASAGAGGSGVEGQKKLQFAAAGKNSITTAAVPPSPILVNSQISSSPRVVAIPGTTPVAGHGRTLRRRNNVSYIDLSSGAEDEEDDFKVLSQAPTAFRAQSILGGQVTKGKTVPAGIKQAPMLIAATSPAVPLQPPAPQVTPGKLTDKQLRSLGMNASVFRSFGRSGQTAILMEYLAKHSEDEEAQKVLKAAGLKSKKQKVAKPSWAPVFEEAALNAAKREDTKKREQAKAERAALAQAPIKLIFVAKKPTFARKSELEEIQKVLAEWMEGVGLDHAPSLDEVDDLKRFCLASVSRDPKQNGGRGPDIPKICAILEWWKYLIEQRHRTANLAGSQRSAVHGWQEAWKEVKEQVDRHVELSTGAALLIR